MSMSPKIMGYPRPDGGFGLRNIVLAISLIDLANDVAARIAQAVPNVVALLTPAGGLSFGEEARLIHRLRWRLARNPNVVGVILIGPAPPTDAERIELAEIQRPYDVIALLNERDVSASVARGVNISTRILAEANQRQREERDLSALCVGLRSSSSSLESARLVNPLVGAVVDQVIDAGGASAFGELADLAGVVDKLAARGATSSIATALAVAMTTPLRILTELDTLAPDPTPTNRHGGIGSLEAKGQGALRRLGRGPISQVFSFGDRMADQGLQMMEGPGSAATCLIGLGAAGCNLIIYTVGSISATATLPFVPTIKVGPPALRESGDLDWSASESDVADNRDFLDRVCAIASGRSAASELEQIRQVILPSALPLL